MPAHGQRLRQADLEFSISPRTPEQLMAFYAARGFPPAAVEVIAASCFLTVGIVNHGRDVVWLEPARWRFETLDGRPVRRLAREEWEARFERLAVPLAPRATFGWTQLPESRDLQPGEPVGGNVAVEPPAGPFRLIARFRTGADGNGPPLKLRVEPLTCPGSQP
ncbi:hypothetical protein [Thiobacter aerophilum]|uniref:Uncharacterized protein n=1 Tax=Thiobacter aerophilum TaxID=3121275 RepID=A0ABV0EC22_9BURK